MALQLALLLRKFDSFVIFACKHYFLHRVRGTRMLNVGALFIKADRNSSTHVETLTQIV